MNYESFKERFNWIKKNPHFLFLYNEIRRRSRFFTLSHLNDKQAITKLYKRYTGREIDWENHKRFTEKLQLLKFYYADNPVVATMVDKYGVREFIEQNGFGDTLNELYGVWTNAKDINLDNLPDKFVLKVTNGSSWNIICKDKEKLIKNWNIQRKLLNSWMKQNLALYGRELFAGKITPRIICEKYLEDKSGALTDYKIYCFNGKVKLIEVDVDRYGNWKRNYYDENWDFVKLTDCYPHFTEDYKPINFEFMLRMSESLSKDLPYLRVDLYEVNGKVYFGELTPIDGSGFHTLDPDEFDFIMGEWLELPENINDYIK